MSTLVSEFPSDYSILNGSSLNSEAQPTAWTFSSPPSSYPPSPISEPEDVLQAEKEKEKGYLAFKTAKYAEAVALYSKAIELNPSEPSYLTDRAASHMALKRFRPALEDCQLAASLQSAAPSSHTLTRLARCQLAVGLSTSTLSSIHKVLALDPRNAEAILLRDKVQILESHLRNFEDAKVNKDWTLVLLALGKCLSAIECEGTDIPVDWTRRRVELELTRGDWEAANTVAKDAVRLNSNPPDLLTLHGLVLFLMGRLSQALQHATLALRLDPSYEPAMKLRNRVKEVEKLKEEGNATLKNGNLKEAYEKYSECLEHVGESDEEGKGGPIRAILLSKRAGMLLKLERYQDALLDADASLKLYPTFGTLRTRAHIHLHLDNFDSSIADFNSAIQQAQMQGFTTENDTHALRSELKKAESALKRGKTKDYYKILGISRDCSEKAIWKGYRQENLKHHPDNGGSEEKFKLVFEAYAVLSDPYRREMYDLGEDEDGMNVGSSRMSVGFGEMHPSDLPRTYFGGVRSTVQSTMDEKCVTVGSPLSSHQLQEDVVIAIMGPTGSGKSSFINKVNNQAKDKLEMYSIDINQPVNVESPLSHPNRHVVLFDTPGFDDTYQSDSDFLQEIAKWLKEIAKNELRMKDGFPSSLPVPELSNEQPSTVCIQGANYKYTITNIPSNDGHNKGHSVFYSTADSNTPYLIFVYDTDYIIEFQLLSLGERAVPSQLFLRLSQAVLKAHNQGIVLGPYLDAKNISWDITTGKDGMPFVKFKTLPLANDPEGGPPLPPKCFVPEDLSKGGTMESDIYCTPRALFQMIDQMENVIDRSKKFLSTSPEPQGPKIVYDDLLSERKVPLPPHGPSIPAVIVQNKALLRIVNKCLKPWPHRRPTAQILCDMLLDFCKSEIIKSVLHKAGKWVLSKLKCLAP